VLKTLGKRKTVKTVEVKSPQEGGLRCCAKQPERRLKKEEKKLTLGKECLGGKKGSSVGEFGTGGTKWISNIAKSGGPNLGRSSESCLKGGEKAEGVCRCLKKEQKLASH